MAMTAADWIRKLELEKHEEGGYFRETYRSPLTLSADALPGAFGGPRSAVTSIYFLLESGDFSALHRLKADELWHFYSGAPLTLHLLHPDGTYERRLLGRDPDEGQAFQLVVPSGTWFGATVDAPGAHTLAGCTVAPGFEYGDFELGKRSELLALFPRHAELVKRLTR